MENISNVGMVATAGAATGAVAGKLVSGKILKNNEFLQKVLKYENVDKYVSARQDEALEKLMGNVKNSKLNSYMTQVKDKAVADFNSVMKHAKNTKVKWIAGLAAAGLAVGTAATLIYNKVKANKAE